MIGSRLKNFRVHCIVDGQAEDLLYTDTYEYTTNNYPLLTHITLDNLPQCSGINISIPISMDSYLTLCEVEVYSDLECKPLPVGTIVSVSYTNGNKLGSMASFSCKTGYFIADNYNVECKNWTWTKDAPACSVVYCPIPTASTNGKYSILASCSSEYINGVQTLQYGCVIKPFCDVGYNLKSKGQRTCLQNGNFDGEDMTCYISNCSLPKTLNGVYEYQNGSAVTGGFIYYDTKIYLKCDKGYSSSSEGSSRICRENNILAGQVSECYIVTCPYPGQLEHGEYFHNDIVFTSGQIKNYSEVVSVRCNIGYRITNGTGVLTCNENGNWGDDTVVCSPVTCPPLEILPDIIYQYSNKDAGNMSAYKSHVNVSCAVKIRSEMRSCREDGTWEGNQAVCTDPRNPEKTTCTKAAAIAGVTGAGVTALTITVVILLIVFSQRGWVLRRKTELVNRLNDSEKINLESINLPKRGVNVVEKEAVDRSNPIHGEYSAIKEVDSLPSTRSCQNESSGRTQQVNYAFVNDQASHIPKSAIQVKDLSNLVLSGDAAMKAFKQEFERLGDCPHDYQNAIQTPIRGKNKHKKSFADDRSRVELNTDYTHECYIDGFRAPKKFMASKGPTKESVLSFWNMIWKSNCRMIVMLTNLEKPMLDQYWPDHGSAVKYGTVTVTTTETRMFMDFIIREFTLKKDRVKARDFTQFHFTAWPDKWEPKFASSIVQFRNKVKYTSNQAKGPIFVHGSADYGRTGTFIAIDYITDQAKATGYVDVYGCVKKLRDQRPELIRTLEQYMFVHHAAVETLVLLSPAVPSSQFQDTYESLLQTNEETNTRQLDSVYETLSAESQYESVGDVNRMNKRDSNVVPEEELMSNVPTDTGDEISMNVVFLPSYTEKKAFIVTQTPVKTTMSDFWKLVWEKGIYTIVLMNNMNEMKKDDIYYPCPAEKLQFETIGVTNDSTIKSDVHTVINITVTSFTKKRSLRLFQCGGWDGNVKLPDSPAVLLSLLETVQTWQSQTGDHTILVHCMNGTEKSGLFCVVSSVIERMKIEKVVAISQTIEDMRHASSQIIPNAEQYKFCHDVVLTYIQRDDVKWTQ